ncbi:MAG: IPT/TIG domain-containing protein [Anaerolineae bacterium]
MTQPTQRRPSRLILKLALALLVLTPLLVWTGPDTARGAAPAARPYGAAAARPADVPPPEFLAAQPTFAGLMEVNDEFAVGGGFLYWWICRGPGMAGKPETTPRGYLRRWPLAGGAVATLSDANFCPSIITADTDGLYYWEDGYLRRRSFEDPTTAVNLLPLRQPRSRLVLDSQFVFFIYDNGRVMRWPKFTVWQDERYDELLEPVADAGAGAGNLVLSGDNLMWFGDGQVYSVAKGCLLDGCARRSLAAETGDRLDGAVLSGPNAGTTTNPLWVTNRKMRGVRCAFAGGGTSCTTRTVYDPQGNAPPEQVYEIGRMVHDGRYLFWLENYQTCNPLGCSYGDFGELRRWPLDQTVGLGVPAPQPETLVARTPTYYLSRSLDAPLAVGNGWVYFRTNLGITRVRVDAPPAPPDVRITGWEITQGIQSPGLAANGNDVPLVAGKPTYVRVYGRRAGGPRTNGIKARLEAWKAGGYLGVLRPLNGHATLAFPLPGGNETSDRTRLDNGWLFQLPDNWTEWGSIRLKATIESPSLDRDVARDVSFADAAPICTVFIPVRTQNRVRMFGPDHGFAVEMAERLLPTPKIWRFYQDNDVARLQPRFGLPPWEYVPFNMSSDSTLVLLSLLLRDKLSDDPDVCDNAGARTHYVGVVAGDPNGDGMDTAADGNNGSSFLGWDQMWFRLPFPAGVRPSQEWRYQRAPTLAHELGHDYGRKHVNCPVGGPDDTDPTYPYPTCQMDQDDGATAHYGLIPSADASDFEIILPRATGDLMSYAHQLNPAKPRWTSDWTWKGILAEIPGGYRGSPDQPGLAAAKPSPRPASDAAAAELAAASDAVLIRGVINPAPGQSSLGYAWVAPTAAVSRRMLAKWQANAASAYVALRLPKAAGAYHLRLLGAGGAVLDDRAITLPTTSDPPGSGVPFFLSFPAPTGSVESLMLMDGETELARRTPGSRSPTLSIVTPSGGETFDADLTLAWRASDPDAADSLLFSVQYSPDDGQTWRALLTDLPNVGGTDTMNVSLRSLLGTPGSKTVSRVRVLASDGYHTALATSAAFTLSNRPPQPYIDMPSAAQTIAPGGAVILRGGANDAEDGVLGGDRLGWQVSGPLPSPITGSGRQLTLAGLPPGVYHASLSATDSAATSGMASVDFTVAPLAIPTIPTPALDGACDDDAYAGARRVELEPYDDGSAGVALLGRAGDSLYVCFTGLPRTSGTSPGSLAALRVDTHLSQGAALDANDYEFFVKEDGVPSHRRGDAVGWISPGPGGFTARVTADDVTWNAELRVDLAVLGGWNRGVGLTVSHDAVAAAYDDHPWPHTAQADAPATWAVTRLGSLPQITGLAPSSAVADGGDLALTVSGAGFEDGATVYWNDTPLPTTFVEAGTLSAAVPGALLAAGEARISVANPGPGHPTSSSAALLVSNPVPSVTSASLSGRTLTVEGARFAANAQVLWNGEAQPTLFVSAERLSAEIDGGAMPANGSVGVAVANPEPSLGLSNVFALPIGQAGEWRIFLPLVARQPTQAASSTWQK